MTFDFQSTTNVDSLYSGKNNNKKPVNLIGLTAIQIVNRFHLIVNFSECMYGIIKNLLPDLKKMHKPKIQMISNNGLVEKEIEEIERIK